MYLSKLEIFGFKSFAQKVNIDFDSGLTAIVGPNGCGKTNVVDALRWALGEQRPTTLRSDKMEDVIFNGTKSRKPLGVAEVSITIENTKGILPVEYSEVTVTRRVFRSGESEYYLNKTLCRLKDIRDLFMDTGMGSDAYSVIELKMVESILSDSSDERRRLFEESAGVTKYKHRRKEALRRLEDVRMNLARVSDNVRGVEKAVETLDRQAKRAERYNELVKQLQTLEENLIEREYSSVVSRISPLTEQLSVAVTEKNRIEVEVQQEEAVLEVYRAEMNELEESLRATQEDLGERQSRIHGVEQQHAMHAERRRSLLVNIEHAEREIVDLARRKEENRKAEEELARSRDEVRAKVVRAETEYGEKKSALDAFEKLLNAKRGEVKSSQERVITHLQDLSELRNRENKAKARLENIRGRIGHTTEENQAYTKEVAANDELIARLTAENKELRRSFAEAEVRTHQTEDYRLKLQGEIDQLHRRTIDIMGEMERRQARIEFLKGLVESYDGYSEGVRFLITNEEWSSRIQTTVGEALQADPRYRVAIEAALGEAESYVVVESVEQAYAAMDFLKRNQKGKATFICLNRMPAFASHRPELGGPGIVGWADGVVQYDSRYAPLFRFLFDETIIVEGVEVANRLTAEHANLKCITLDGEIISGRGVVRGGSVRVDEGGHISKKNQLDELAEEVRKLGEKHETIEREIRTKGEELENLDLRKLTEVARSIEQQKTSVEVRIAQIEFEKKRALESIERNESESSGLSTEVVGLKEELDRLAPAVERLDTEKAAAERNVGIQTSELETMEAFWDESSRQVNEANVAVLSLKSEERSIVQSIEHIRATQTSIASTSERRKEEIDSAREEITQIERDRKESDKVLESLKREYEGLLERKRGVDKDFSAKRSVMHEIELKLKDGRVKQEGSLKAAHDLEFKIQELTLKAENLKSRAKEKFEIELEYREFPDSGTFDLNAARAEADKLSEKIHNLGAVNFEAFAEYKSEKERLDFVVAQRDDLLDSEKTLLTTIDEINTTAQQKFMETFGQIRENFISTFKGLFDEGDECDLRLEDGIDPLEARIEIIAKPRGKRPTSIDLLSGGEKTLTAIALLFAIYLVKPSPFCILDEVDAPLDDTNIDRFTKILRKFANNTQFVVVTHNKRTMEAANAMYGVTMEEEGISKLVSVKFNEHAEKV
ncbi:MAG TPA: chromosome segregation protein SMC [Bacteroidota bacterium]|nr:chromosome segregation protein SMC [Bacteroidota bacterium]